jgi:PPOX class probable F420-dependent enzyme
VTFDEILPFLEANHQGVIVAFRRNGAAQPSIVTCGPYQGGVAFTTTGDRAKLANLRRDPRSTILVSKPDWSGYVVVEGTADIRWSDRTDPDELRLTLREVYRVCAGREHPDWDDYDRAMVEDRRAAIIIKPGHIYGVRM